MVAKVSILAGPARSGKTDALLLRYRQVLAEQADGNASGAALWIAPTKYAAAEIRGRLLQDGLTGCFSPGVYTFERFAQTLLAASDEPPRYLGRLFKRQLIQRLLDEFHTADKLKYFAPIANTAGLVDLIDGLISDLKRQEILPHKFSELIESVAPSEKNREIATLYAEYQARLDHHQMHDIEGRFWAVSKLLRETPLQQWGPFSQLKHIVVDGFTDFTRSQHEVLRLLAAKAPQLDDLTITLPLEAGSEREDLFLKPRRSLEEFKRRHLKLILRWHPCPSSNDWLGLAHLEHFLFCNPREVKPATDASRIEIIAAAGQKAEIEVLARRIKSLLVLGDDQQNNQPVRPGDIAIVFRSVEPLASLVEEVFAEYGIPMFVDAPPRLQRSPLLQALLAILRLQAGDWQFRQLLAVLSNNYFRPAWPEWQQPDAAAAVEWAVRQVQTPNGRQALLAALQWRSKSDFAAEQAGPQTTADGEPSNESDAKRHREHRRRYEIALAVLSHLNKALPSPDKPQPLSTWVAKLDDVVENLGCLPVSGVDTSTADTSYPSLSRYDPQAWRHLKNVLSAGNQLEDLLNVEPTRLTLSQFVRHLQDILSIEQLPTDRDNVGRVRILSTQSIRALRVPYLFVAGLAEKVFPPPARDDRIYSDAEYRSLNAAGLHFVDGRQRSSEEMLLFYEVITRPTRRLTLSYPALDEAAQPLLPSPYLNELERCCGEGKITRTIDISLSPVPQHDHPFSPTELRTKAVAELVENNPQRLAHLISKSKEIDIGVGRKSVDCGVSSTNVIDALQAIAARRQQDFGPFEGLLTGEAAKLRMSQQFGSDHCWSVSRLEEYAYCPFQFFAQNVLNLEELPDLALETDFGRRGQLAHEALATLHRRLNSAGTSRSPAQLADEEYAQLANGAVEFVQGRIPQGSPLEIALRTVDLQLIGQWLQEYFGQHVNYDEAIAAISPASQDQALRPAHFEVSFGLKPRTNEELDPLSTETPFELLCDGDTVRFSGRIDRIDIGLVGDQVVFNVLDYKTGSSKGFKSRSFESGVSLQLPLYALAVQELLMIDRRAVPWRVGYWFVKEKGFDDHGLPQFFERAEVGVRESADWQTLRGALVNRIGSLVRGIRGGMFPVFSLDDECTGRCPYSTVCRIGQIRSLGKTWNAADISPVNTISRSPGEPVEAGRA